MLSMMKMAKHSLSEHRVGSILSSSFSPPTFFFSSLSTPPYSAPVSLLYTPFHSSSSHLYSFLHLPIVELKLLNSTQSSSHFFFFSDTTCCMYNLVDFLARFLLGLL
ncbi:hypothetical protein GYH30_034565 [Glycine max]|uniref:Uncharacterized protein n=1 Tax=Glycine max TaxID=3847 RepID=A0A0R0HH71_SOYBN|nr:hypothetical protein GYH30_034565 [Glycine max]